MKMLGQKVRQKDAFMQEIPDKVAELSDESNLSASDIELADNTTYKAFEDQITKKSHKKNLKASFKSDLSGG